MQNRLIPQWKGGLAFVAFTTQFGGGFASGAQIYQYFINYGIWCLILPAVTQGLYALFFWYGMRYAYKHKTYDYRSFSDSLYGKTTFKPRQKELEKYVYDAEHLQHKVLMHLINKGKNTE